MPLYDYECLEGHVFEKFVPLADYLLAQACPICSTMAIKVFLTQRQARNAKAFEPSVFFEKDGELFVGGTNDPNDLRGLDKKLLKEGWTQITISNYREYEQFQRSHSKQLRAKQQADIQHQREIYDTMMKENIDAIKQGYIYEKPVYNDAGEFLRIENVKIPPLHELHPTARAIAEQAIKQSHEGIESFQEYEERVYIDAFENDRPRTEDERGGKKWY